MVYLACQHAIKMVVMWETNQHSLHDIYVHGGLYPTHACTQGLLILMNVHDCCRSLVGRLPVFF